MSIPRISIVGRPNVGKSSLLNCLAGKRISIVDPTPGVTRDRVSYTVALNNAKDDQFVEFVDTGGIGIVDSDELDEDIERQISFGIKKTDIIIFLVDGRQGPTKLDRRVAERLRKTELPVIFVANKIDAMQVLGETAELHKLGFGPPLEVSAMQHRNIDLLLREVKKEATKVPSERPISTTMELAIVGKRNAGKSTIINALVGHERVIVSEVPGTTRDSVDVDIEVDGEHITLIDTAGLKRKKKISGDIEFYCQHRSMRSIRRADVVAIVIDASLPVSKIDKNLAGVVTDEFKPAIIIVNKWDLARDRTTTEEYSEYFTKTFPSLSFAPICFVSATEELNLERTVKIACELHKQAQSRVTTGQLNKAMEIIKAERGPSHKAGTALPKIYYASQVSISPPTIVCFVNHSKSFDQSYRRFLVNRFRDHLPFPEVPIRLLIRAHGDNNQPKKNKKDSEQEQEDQDK